MNYASGGGVLSLLHSEWPKLYGVLAVLSAVGVMYVIFLLNPFLLGNP